MRWHGDSGRGKPREGGERPAPGRVGWTDGGDGWMEGLDGWRRCCRHGDAATGSDGLRSFPGARGCRDAAVGNAALRGFHWENPCPGSPGVSDPKRVSCSPRALPGVPGPVPVSCRVGPGGQQQPRARCERVPGGRWGQVRASPHPPRDAPAPPLRPCQPLVGVLLLFPSGLQPGVKPCPHSDGRSEDGKAQPARNDRREKGTKLWKRSPWQPGLPLPAATEGES